MKPTLVVGKAIAKNKKVLADIASGIDELTVYVYPRLDDWDWHFVREMTLWEKVRFRAILAIRRFRRRLHLLRIIRRPR